MIFRPALRLLTRPFPLADFAARFLAAVVLPPLLFLAIFVTSFCMRPYVLWPLHVPGTTQTPWHGRVGGPYHSELRREPIIRWAIIDLGCRWAASQPGAVRGSIVVASNSREELRRRPEPSPRAASNAEEVSHGKHSRNRSLPLV